MIRLAPEGPEIALDLGDGGAGVLSSGFCLPEYQVKVPDPLLRSSLMAQKLILDVAATENTPLVVRYQNLIVEAVVELPVFAVIEAVVETQMYVGTLHEGIHIGVTSQEFPTIVPIYKEVDMDAPFCCPQQGSCNFPADAVLLPGKGGQQDVVLCVVNKPEPPRHGLIVVLHEVDAVRAGVVGGVSYRFCVGDCIARNMLMACRRDDAHQAVAEKQGGKYDAEPLYDFSKSLHRKENGQAKAACPLQLFRIPLSEHAGARWRRCPWPHRVRLSRSSCG